MEVQENDTIEIVSNKVGEPHRRAVVERVLEGDPLRLEVTWEDGHSSVLVPTGGNLRVVTGSE
jgi:hypothetical protein